MRYVVDLHSHSGYSGGVGNISLGDVAATMAVKGIHAFGAGDCLHAAWLEKLSGLLVESEPGLYRLAGGEGSSAQARFVMQTEIIITCPVASGGRKIVHVVVLLPGIEAAREAIRLLRRWEVKLEIGRPFVKCADAAQVAERCEALRAIDDSIMIIPAHVLTPQGIYGSDRPVDSMADIFGEFARRITTVETGLSADPKLLAMLPELDGRTLVSNSDCHSGALNRVGREFTALDISGPSYPEIVQALRGRRVRYTAEFDPAEGRYFLTGHRAGLAGHGRAFCYFSPDRVPADGLCPVCGKPLTVGVLDRVLHLARVQAGGKAPRRLDEVRPAQEARALVPLVEVIAAGLGIKSVASPKVVSLFNLVVGKVGAESELWELPPGDIEHAFSSLLPERALKAILQVRAGDFSFQPGYDGQYGRLRLGEGVGWFGQEEVSFAR